MGTRGRAIVGMDVEELLRVLNRAYASEWLAYYQYWLGAKLIKGPMKDAVAAELNLHATESTVPTLRILLGRAVHRLGVLIGEHPAALYEILSPAAAPPQVPDRVAIGFPNDILRQRPDIRRAERQLASQTARIGVATADLFPQLSLLGDFHFEALDSHNILQSTARAWFSR